MENKEREVWEKDGRKHSATRHSPRYEVTCDIDKSPAIPRRDGDNLSHFHSPNSTILVQ